MFTISNIEVLIGLDPNEADIAIASTDNEGNIGQLNKYVLNRYDYSTDRLPKYKDLENGYYFWKEIKNRFC